MSRGMRQRGRRVVVDTSVLVAGIAGFRVPYQPGRNPSADLLHTWLEEGSFVWLLSREVLEEYREVLRRCGVRRHTIGRLVNLLQEEAELVPVGASVDISPDPRDNAFCACAEQGRADFLVTLNPKDFPQQRLATKVAHPARLLKRAKWKTI